eukprot:357886-Chlamydomonas_euryale.AAC.17
MVQDHLEVTFTPASRVWGLERPHYLHRFAGGTDTSRHVLASSKSVDGRETPTHRTPCPWYGSAQAASLRGVASSSAYAPRPAAVPHACWAVQLQRLHSA